jgi:cysteine-rich repeat protein
VRALCGAAVSVRGVRGLVHAYMRGQAARRKRGVAEGYCDDGNLESGDGCSSGCQVECGTRAGRAGTHARRCAGTVCGRGRRSAMTGTRRAGTDAARREVEAGWACSMATCSQSVCVGGGCPVGFSGSDCAPCKLGLYGRECAPCDCNGHGRCGGGSGECECYPGWTGDECTDSGAVTKVRRRMAVLVGAV